MAQRCLQAVFLVNPRLKYHLNDYMRQKMFIRLYFTLQPGEKIKELCRSLAFHCNLKCLCSDVKPYNRASKALNFFQVKRFK